MEHLLDRRAFTAGLAVGAVSLIEVPPVRGEDENTEHWISRAADDSKTFDAIHCYAHGFGDKFKRNEIISSSYTILHSRP